MQEGTTQMEQLSGQGYGTHPSAESLVTWFTENGGRLSPDVHIVYSESRGYHMRATRPLSSPVVASCPLKLTLSHLNLDPDQEDVLSIESPLQQCRGQIPDHILSYLLLIEQRNKATESPWHAYMACLPGPESMTTPLWFNEDDMVFLKGTSLAPAARERRAELHQQWEHALAVMKELGVSPGVHVDPDLLMWAATVFTSRAFISSHILPERETIPILFPVVDILNHSVSAKVEWDFQPHQSFILKCLEGESFQPGQELFNNYAPKQNDELLLGYGFCLEDNPIEQFALKLAFQPQLQQYAQELGLLSAGNVPFGMSPTFLDTDPNKEQHFLRAKGHPFGRYDNHIPFFRGVPPYIVHFFFIQSVITMDLDIADMIIERPGERVTLQVLVLLHQALEQRCSTLPLRMEQEPENEKQKYAKIYRDNQAKIIHSVREELKAAIDQLRATTLSRLLHSLPETMATFKSDFPTAAHVFETGLHKHKGRFMDQENQDLVWTLLLTVLVATMLTSPNTDCATSSLLLSLFKTHTLPALEDGIDDADTYTFVDENLADFIQLDSSGAAPTDVLDDLGMTFVNQPDDSTTPVFINGRTENLGVRIIMWAMKVVGEDVVSVFGDGKVDKCLFTRGGSGEWMYEDTI